MSCTGLSQTEITYYLKSLDSLTALAPEKGGDPRSGEDRKRIEALDGYTLKRKEEPVITTVPLIL